MGATWVLAQLGGTECETQRRAHRDLFTHAGCSGRVCRGTGRGGGEGGQGMLVSCWGAFHPRITLACPPTGRTPEQRPPSPSTSYYATLPPRTSAAGRAGPNHTNCPLSGSLHLAGCGASAAI